jgi:hypothetical protein
VIDALSTDGRKEGIECRGEGVDAGFEVFNLLRREELSAKRAAEPVLGLAQRAARQSDEPAVVRIAPSAASFRNVGADTVCSAYELFSHRIARQRVPAAHDSPRRVGQLFRQRIHAQVLKIRSHLSHLPIVL